MCKGMWKKILKSEFHIHVSKTYKDQKIVKCRFLAFFSWFFVLYWVHVCARACKKKEVWISYPAESESWGEWPSGLRRCDQNRKVPGSNPTRHLARLRDPTSLQGSWWTPHKRLTSGEWSCLPNNVPKLVMGQPNSS